jgi:signal transduction histidine kinase
MSSDRTLIRTARSLAATSCVLALGSLIVATITGELVFWWRSFAAVQAGVALTFGVFVWLVVPHQPRNRAVWAMAASTGAAVNAAALALVPLLMDGDPSVVLDPDWVPADTPAVAWVQVIGNAASVPGLFAPLTLGLLLFPDGALPSRRGRLAAAVATTSIAVLAVTHGWWYRPTNASRAEAPVLLAALFVLIAMIAVSVISLVRRFRRSSGRHRLQYKWVVWGTGIAAATFGGFAFVPDTAKTSDSAALVAVVATVCWAVAYGIALGRYRLYEIDLVISRTLVYLALAALIAGVYVAVVVVLGSALGGSSIWMSMLATALVAVTFEPARTHLQQWANRLVYGHRATPYEILGHLTRQLAVVERHDELLERLAAQLCAGTGALRVTVWLDDAGALRPVAVAPAGATAPEIFMGTGGLPGHDVAIEHEGEVLGHLTVEEDPARSLRPTDTDLARDLARSAALVVHKFRLDRDLATTAAEIAESRRRLIDAQDNELRRLERELNSTVEQDVVALKVQIGLAERVARDERSDRAATLLAQLATSAQDAIGQIRSLAQGIYPPLLDADGLTAAIPALGAQAPLDVRVEIDVDHRHPPEFEGAVYFCVSEALTNASKHAHGPVTISVTDRAGALTFTVTDSGPGFDADHTTPGSGLHNMHDRLDALGGNLALTSHPGASTTITGTLPLDVMSPA